MERCATFLTRIAYSLSVPPQAARRKGSAKMAAKVVAAE
jgi:hypothetical protein